MATLSKPVGYEYEFVDQVPEDYFCKLCKHVAREPIIASCCTEILCKAGIDVTVQEKKPCPSCEDVEIKELGLHSKNQTKILALEVHCTQKNRGCEWTEQLQHLDAHLDVTTGDCQYVDVECPNKCDQKLQKRNVDTHLANECTNREYRCPHCNFTDTFHIVTEQHWEVCSYYPLACPNRCGATFERGDLEDHMKMCRLEEVQCEYSSDACQAKFIRDNEDKHMDQNTQKHIAMMPAATLRISQEQQTFEQKLQEQVLIVEQKCQEHDENLKMNFQTQEQTFEQKLQELEQINEQKHREQEQTFEQKLQEQGDIFKRIVQEQEQNLKKQEQTFEQKFQERECVLQKELQEKAMRLEQVERALRVNERKTEMCKMVLTKEECKIKRNRRKCFRNGLELQSLLQS